METLLQYFESIPSSHRSIMLVSGIVLFWVLETGVPLFKYKYNKWQHALPNFFFTLTTIAINFALAFVLLLAANWVTTHNFGILNWLPVLPLAVYVFIGVLLLDFFGAYLAHYVEHKVKLLWMVHLVHHTDHKVDTTTANRHHPVESVIRFAFTLLGVVIVGTPLAIVMLYQALSLVFSQFTHANIKLPKALDKWLSYIVISPDMHKTHHHYRLPYTDSNYGNIFSIWDRVFGTYRYMDREYLIYGVDVFPNATKNTSIKHLLQQPFQPYEKPTFSPKTEQKL